MKRKIRLSYVLTALAIWVMARSTFRNIGLFGITLGVLAAVQWQTKPRWNASSKWTGMTVRWNGHWNAFAAIVILIGFSAFIATNGLYQTEQVRRRFGIGASVEWASPARQFIDEHIPVDAQVFNSFRVGSRYLFWFYPERLPLLDGNGDGYPPEFYREYIAIFRGEQPFGPFARRYEIDWLFFDLRSLPARRFYLNPRWYPVYLDSDDIILVNGSKKFSELRQKMDLRKELKRGHIPNWRPTKVPTFFERTNPFREHTLARFLSLVGERRAADVVRKHVSRFEDGTE